MTDASNDNQKKSSGKKRRRRRRGPKKDGAEQNNAAPTNATDDAVEHDPTEVIEPKRRERKIVDESIFEMENGFEAIGLKDEVMSGITRAGFKHPTHVQAQLIPVAMEGKDILGQSRTGTGKTAAFALPVLQNLDGSTPFAAMILTPTRELAIQVTHEMRELGRDTDLHIVAVYGGQRMNLQIAKLEKKPHIIVGTPGRVMDMHQRGHLPYDNMKMAILDEVDRMLDIGFRDDIRKILGGMPKSRQTIFVSATISDDIDRLARKYMKDPVKLELTAKGSLTVNQVEQYYTPAERWDKKQLLVHVLRHEDPALTLVFCRTKQTVDGLTEYLNRKGIESHAIHGDMYQGKRNRVMQKLRDGQLSVLVASDLAARGLDVDDITHVINYDIPEDPEVYVHRIGRTARAGREGWALTFVAPDQGPLLTNVEMLTNLEIPKREYDKFKPGPIPRDVMEEREKLEALREQMSRDRSRSSAAPPVSDKEKSDETAFPGGIVPKAAPAVSPSSCRRKYRYSQSRNVERAVAVDSKRTLKGSPPKE